MKQWESELREQLNERTLAKRIRAHDRAWRDFAVSLAYEKSVRSAGHHAAVHDHIRMEERYAVARALKFTHKIVVTPQQRAALGPLWALETWTAQWCMIRRDTGATAIVLKSGGTWMTVYEDGSTTGNARHSDLRMGGTNHYTTGLDPDVWGSWHYNTRVKRDYIPPAPKKLKKTSGGFVITRYAR